MISFIFCCKIEFFHYQLMGLMLVMSANAKTIDFIVFHQTWVEKLRLTLPLFLTEKCNLFLRIKNMTRKYQIACKQLLCQSKGKQAATEWTPDCLQKWYNFDQNCLSKLLQLTMKPELHTGIFGIRDHSIIQQWWPRMLQIYSKSTHRNAPMISSKFHGHILTFEWDMAKNDHQ